MTQVVRPHVWLWLCVLFAIGLARPVAADPALRVQMDVNGDFVLIGNTLAHECSTGMPVVPAPVVGTVQDCPDDNPFAPDVYWRADSPAANQARADASLTPGQARSTAVLELPDGAEVVHARLYWAALSAAASPDASVSVQRPSVMLDTTITADDTFEVMDPADNGRFWYHSTADVTSLVSAQGNGPYRIAGVASVNIVGLGDPNPVAAWALVVFYELSGEPSRNLAIFDGLDLVDENIGSAEATLDGFLVPMAGFDAKLGVITYEGEAQFTGDSLLFNGTSLSNGPNPANNFFNATRTLLGVPVSVTGDLPQLTGGPRSLSNVDLDVVSVTTLVDQGDSSATIEATSTLDTFLLGAFVTSISTFKPEFLTSTKEVIDANGGAIRPGDTLTYRITAENTGTDAAIGTLIEDPLPEGVTYVEGTLEITDGDNAGELTDAAGDDQGEVTGGGRTVLVRIGQGASASMGGELAVSESTVVEFQVTVDDDASGTIANQAIITAEGAQGAPSEDTPTDGNGDSVGQPPTEVTVDGCEDDDDCDGATPFCDTGSEPRTCVECITSEQCEDPDAPDCSFEDHTCGCEAGTCNDGDGDGISDSAEMALGTDPNDRDSDDDGVSDGAEIAPNEDSDGDGVKNALDADSDNDGLFDGTELGFDCEDEGTDASLGHCRPDADEGATKTDPIEADTDGGGVSDGSEDSNLDGKLDPGETDPGIGAGADDEQVSDRDGDGLSDDLEATLRSDPDDADSDDDGVSDGREPNPGDDVDGDGLPSVLDVDSDDDGLFDGTELGLGCGGDDTDRDAGHCRADSDGGDTVTSPLLPDTDGGGARDGSEDANLNGVTDAGESDPTAGHADDDDDVPDADMDGLGDGLEAFLGTDPEDKDSDDDGVPDGSENNPSDDHDGDDANNALDVDSDGDGLFDGTERGFDCEGDDTDASDDSCRADADEGATTTSAVNRDTDYGGKPDGDEDEDHNGRLDDGETDPNDARDDRVGEECATDADCGEGDSGVICVEDVCDLGCRGEDGNGCPDGIECSSTTREPGVCGEAPEPDDGGMPMAGEGGVGGSDAGMAGEGGSSGAAGGLPDPGGLTNGTLGGGGCDCRAAGKGAEGSLLAILIALGLLVRRRKAF